MNELQKIQFGETEDMKNRTSNKCEDRMRKSSIHLEFPMKR